MKELLSNPAVAPIIMVFMVPMVISVAYFWHEVMKARSNNELKQSMIERGMSAEEIEKVLNAGTHQGKKK